MMSSFGHWQPQRRQGEENFWPSFADMMMVIVMIFLMIMVAVLVKNWDLVEQLKAAMISEQQTKEEVKVKTSENMVLEQRLQDAENQLSLLRMRLLAVESELDSQIQETKLAEQSLIEAQTNLEEEKDKLLAAKEDITKLSSELSKRDSLLKNQGAQLAKAQQDMLKTKEAFDILDKKYQKLIKPARTSKGKFVIEVVYIKTSNSQYIEIHPQDGPKKSVSETELHSLLQDYKAKHPGKIYLKVIFPKSTQISHHDAWQFTSDLLGKYDYYYQ